MTALRHADAPFWDRDAHRDRKPFLAARSRILRALRHWFEDQGFTEVETATLQVSPGNEPHLTPFATRLKDAVGRSREVYLHTSPEFACKKLLAAGEEKIVTFARVFRNGERGPLHHPEFTMLEWYRANAPLEVLMDDCAALLRVAAQAAGVNRVTWRGREADPLALPSHVSVAEAFAEHAGIDLLATLDVTGLPDYKRFARDVTRAGIRVTDDDSWSDLFSKVLSDRIEHRLGEGAAAILHDYPAPEAALAKLDPADPRVAKRFELYVCGVELANAFEELTDPAVQRARFREAAELRRARYGDEPPPIDEDFIAALGHMPPASGIALGFDRLVMLLTGATRIEQVLWTPVVETQAP